MQKLIFRGLFIAAGIAGITTNSALAQNERDALRYSMLQPQGTARSIGFGSALGSVGGDFSALAVNPAGIGIYRSSEIMFTPSLTFSNTSSAYTGNSASESGAHFAISNFGLVTTSVPRGRRREHNGWSSFSFGIGLTRLADFTRDYSYQGTNTTSSGSYIFENDAQKNGISNDGVVRSPGDLGYQSYLLDSNLATVVKPGQYPVGQSMIVHERGGLSEVDLSFGGSYKEKLMVGATIGVPVIRYTKNETYEEHDLSGNDNNNFDNFRYTDNLSTTGAGINLKLGMIYKPVENFRFGLAVHTPSYFSLTDIDNQELVANTENFGLAESGSAINTATAVENKYDYNLTTPWRGIASGTVLFGKHGFFTLDYEYVDYASTRMKFGSSADEKAYEQYINDLIKSSYQGASNIRTGVEIRLDNLMLRAGFGYYGNPYKSGNPSAERLDFSGGIGFRFDRVFIDLGFVHHQYKLSEQPYELPNEAPYMGLVVPTADLNTGANNAVVTFGVKL